jgi:hypothetical protein
MGELLAVTCDSCGAPMLPNVSTLDEHGCGWICLDPDCPELAAAELEAEDLVEAGVPTELARRLTKLILRRADEADTPARARERAQADLARLRQDLPEAQRLASEAAALAVASALSCLAAHTAREACAAVAGIDPDLPGLRDWCPRALIFHGVDTRTAPLTPPDPGCILDKSPPRAGLAAPPGVATPGVSSFLGPM